MTPRLITLAEALAYLSGRHPSELNLKPLGSGKGQRWDLKAINAKLDQMAKLTPDAPARGAANDDEADELTAIRERLGASESV